MAVNLPDCPASLKQIQHYLKTACEHDVRDPVVSYWCRLHALQVGLKLSSNKTPEETKLLLGLMDWLELQKQTHQDNEAITNEVAAQAHLENYGLKLFLYADKQDREGNFGKNVVKAFYTAGMIFDVLTTFGDLTEEVQQNRKYAKWKAAYIHNCLKNGETPIAGPIPTEDDDDLLDENQPGPSQQPSYVLPQQPQAPPPVNNMGFTPYNPPGFTPYDNSDVSGGLPTPVIPSEPITPRQLPGGFQQYVSQDTAGGYNPEVNLTPDQIARAQKYCKFAGSALSYDDVKTAVDNLLKALQLLQTGVDVS